MFEAYVEQEKAKALAILCSEERLDSIKLNGLLENYLFTDVMPREDEVAETLTLDAKDSGTQKRASSGL